MANELKELFADGAHFVPLEAIQDPDLVPPTILRTLEIPEARTSPLEWLMTRLKDRELLLLLDNFEHILDAAPGISRILETCPNVHVLVTSRAVLGLRGEVDVALAPLGLPQATDAEAEGAERSEAVQLLLTRARESSYDFELQEEDIGAVVEICRQLDGLPLALELAAARIKLLTPRAMLARLGNRFGLLSRGPRHLPDRHQALRATIDWSYELLGDADKRFFARCSVFEGGWSLDAAEAVCDLEGDLNVLNQAESLLDKSLLRHVDRFGVPRFTMLETVKRYAVSASRSPERSNFWSRGTPGISWT